MKYVIGLVVVAIVVGFVAMQTLLGPTSDDVRSADQMNVESSATAEPAAVDTAPKTFTGTDSLESLLALGSSVECSIEFVDEENGQTVSGTFFGDDGRMRGDFIQTMPNVAGPVLASMIVADNMMYSWSEIEGEQYGVKIDLSQFPENDASSYDQGPVTTDEPVEYDCKVWTNVDNSVFEPPATVLFQDMGALLQTGMEYGTIYNEAEF